MGCPDETTALRFVQGQLLPADKQRVTEHVDLCPRCYQTITELAKIISVSPFAATVGGVTNDSGVRHRADDGEVPRPTELALGSHFGRYEIREKLGAGGMGTVYAAFDSTLERKVALKLLHSGVVPSAEAGAFLLAEARAIAALHHPHVVSIYDAGTLDGAVYLSIELVEGETLSRWLAHGRTPAEIVRALLQAADGLSAMHERGLVHRDIKPENILVSFDGAAKLTDFGLARTATEEKGALIGTPAYMSPEQLFARAADARSDQFSFAVMAFEAFTGERPFRGRNLDELRWAMTSGARTPAPRLPRALAATLDVALATDPERRYPSMRHLATALLRATVPTENVHVRVHRLLLSAMWLVHLGSVAYFVQYEPSPPSAIASASAESSGSSASGHFDVAVAGLVVWALVSVMWFPLGVVWAAINAWGIHKKLEWARISTIIYATIGLFTCLGTPYGIYALYSLTRPSVRAAFRETS